LWKAWPEGIEMEHISFDHVGRNIGLLSVDEQRRLQTATVAIAGVGGVGGFPAERLARLGVGRLKLADPEFFDKSDGNRQFGATVKTVGKKKVDVLEEMLTEINPRLLIERFPDGVTQENVSAFVMGADLIIDAIEFFRFAPRIHLYREARRQRVTVMLSGAVAFAAPLLVFTPEAMTMEEYFSLDSRGRPDDFFGILQRLCPRLPSYIPPEIGLSMLRRERPISTLSPACALAGVLLASESLLMLLGKRVPVVVPQCTVVDLFTREFVTVNIATGEGVVTPPLLPVSNPEIDKSF
jgi:tRNA threonylcarbamoyladenosine dehydratase